jgi:uncharacterized protein (TIRG00374 family)
VTGLLLLAGLVVVVVHLGQERQFAELLRRAQPAWLLLLVALQAGTYTLAAGVWQRALAGLGMHRPLGSLLTLGVAKLFTDQALPSAGLSGTVLVVHGLSRRGVPHGAGVGAVLIGLVAFYGAYGIAVALALAILWLFGDLSRPVLLLATGLAVVTAALLLAVVWVRRHGATRLPSRLRRLPLVVTVLQALRDAPVSALRKPALLLETTGLQLAIFVLDAGTLWAALHAVGYTAPAPAVFAAFVTASVVATLSLLPAGIGTFDATCVAMLHVAGVPIEPSLAATLLFRGFTLFVPLVPGLWLARREMRA